jgi:hypothetical protein
MSEIIDSPLDIAIRIDALARKQGVIIAAMQSTLEKAQAELGNIRKLVPMTSCTCDECLWCDAEQEKANG